MNWFHSLLRRADRREHTGTARMSHTRLHLESMESRLVPATIGVEKWAVLDFDGEYISASEMTTGGWSDKPAQSVLSFRSLFGASRPRLDMNGDGLVNTTDANLAQDVIVRKVQQDFAPYDVSVFVDEEDNRNNILTDGVVGDAIALVTGSRDTLSTQNAWGWAPVDSGNSGDDYAFIFAGGSVDSFSSRDEWLNQVARTISHELGHTFGLEHEESDSTGSTDPITHSIMGTVGRDFTRDFVFQDRSFSTEDGVSQNCHQYLNRSDVLGESNRVWMQVQEPGVLTVSGNSAANVMRLLPRSATSWDVVVDGVWTAVDLNSSNTQSLNPFDAPLTSIKFLGKDGNDNIAVDFRMSVPAEIYGGTGDDSLWGGQGNDYIRGGAGNDRIDGYVGNDLLYGESGDDTLIGGNGNDWVYGGTGRDSLYGGSGNDRLDGGNDDVADIVWGQTGSDTYVADWFYGTNVDYPYDFNPGEGDRIG